MGDRVTLGKCRSHNDCEIRFVLLLMLFQRVIVDVIFCSSIGTRLRIQNNGVAFVAEHCIGHNVSLPSPSDVLCFETQFPKSGRQGCLVSIGVLRVILGCLQFFDDC